MLVESASRLLQYLPTRLAEVPRDLNRAQGVLAGLAVGNVLGIPWEGLTADEIREYEGSLLLTAPDPAEVGRSMDDDLAQAVELAEALRESRGVVTDLARRLGQWERVNGRGIGHMTLAVLREWAKRPDFPYPARVVWQRMNHMAPNGGLMRCAPVALRHTYDPGQLISVSARTCAVTHYSPWCQWSCILLNSVIARLLRGESLSASGLAGIIEAVEVDMGQGFYSQCRQDNIPDQVFEELALYPRYLTSDLQFLTYDQHLIGHTLIALQVGLWAAVTAMPFAEALVEVVRVGGDTDTNAAIAGAVLGARYGLSAIPSLWLEAVPELDRLCELAEGLHNRA